MKPRRTRPREFGTCPNPGCGVTFAKRRKSQIYCSDRCRNKHWRDTKLEVRTCLHCGKSPFR